MLRIILLLHFMPFPINSLSILRRIRSKVLPFTLPWYEQKSNTMQFSCTSCGKCCKVDGDVWLSPAEVDTIQSYLGIDEYDSFKTKYGRAEVTNGEDTWVCLRRTTDASSSSKSCVFLDPMGQCSIYDVRPIQCATYPFWPSILASKEDWENEAVIPDDVNELIENERYWTAELGGCEGIILHNENLNQEGKDNEMQNQEKAIVDSQDIRSKIKEVRRHWESFPVDEIKQSTWYL